MNTKPKQRLIDMPPAQQAGILCNDTRFQRFAANRCGMAKAQFNASAAAQYLRDCCKIKSRRELNDSEAALAQLKKLQTEFDQWTGRIGDPRNAA